MKLINLPPFRFGNNSGIGHACLLACLLTGILVSCKKNEMELNKGNAPLKISASKTSLVLDEKNALSDGLVFSWTTGSNQGTNSSISYLLQLAAAGNQFNNAESIDMGYGVLSRKFSVSDLNNLLLTRFQATPGVESAIEARVIAIVSESTVQGDTTVPLTLKVVPYQPVATTLFIIGDAAPNGWDAGNAEPLVKSETQPGAFTWQGNLKSGEFKLITNAGEFLPSYNKGADENHLVYRTADSDPDDKFSITTPGLYDITLNLLDLTISVVPSSLPAYERLWMLGDAVPTGWNIDNPSEMRVDSSNLFLFHYNGILSAGEFKIPVATGNFGTDYYMPLVNNQALTETGAQLVPGGSPDYKWKITNPGPYKITLDIQNNKIYINPFSPYTHIWMVGDATTAGWNINEPVPLVPDPSDPYVFTYTGQMNVGEFKFPLATGDFGCDYFMPVLNASGPGSTQMKFVAKGDPDYKWKMTQAGTYKITINQLYETISIVKQ